MCFLLPLLLLLLTFLHLSAQEAPEPVTTGDPAIAVKKLELQLVPLTVAELQTEAAAWRKLTQTKSVYREVTKRVKQEFDAAGITIPFPRREVHLHQAG